MGLPEKLSWSNLVGVLISNEVYDLEVYFELYNQ